MKRRLEEESKNEKPEDDIFSYFPKDYFYSILLHVVFYFTNLLLIFYYKDSYLVLPASENIVLNYYSDGNLVKIPIYSLIILLGIFVNRLENLIKF
jgi:hypothetical protein